MDQLKQPEHGGGMLRLSDESHASRFAPRIILHAQGLQHAVFPQTINDSDREWDKPMDARSTAFKQDPCTLFAARHQGCAAFV
jgi:hypothetical protein